MPSLKDLKNRIGSVKSTQKITSAMKMVAAAKLRKAQEQAISSRPFCSSMEKIVISLAGKLIDNAPDLLKGKKEINKQLLVVFSADRGLCGGFNGSISRAVKTEIQKSNNLGIETKLLFIGRKSADTLKKDFRQNFVEVITGNSTNPIYNDALSIALKIIELYQNDEFGTCKIIFNKFVSAINQEVTLKSLIPIETSQEDNTSKQVTSVYEYEPEEDVILKELLNKNIATQLFSAQMESTASELAARMTAMDNATRNAGDLIDRLTLQYNRTRQAFITKELIEIISGAEAL
ncbi:MAG: F0F1 ATP synthase subunit gamma [SAR116 cluster bacterium]|nr:F0F1 ATP synthase subunit gamma [SAR116 cluster bacterium]RPH08725.1 MAG: F0F1 ATP synthase subunit gamma [Alphaproteobacteria bacterium TMED54]|tara:strand:+ start:311 stop:1183 length:873 start_codon:yes stop_codon:yes gene_type:complete